MSQNHSILKDKLCLITGATSGIGKATAIGLAEKGVNMVILSRDLSRGETIKKEIVERTKIQAIDVMKGDLGSLKSIKEFVVDFKEKYKELHMLINNAGTYTQGRVETVDGYEKMFAINYLGHFFLTHLLLDTLKNSSPSRIVNVASRAQRALNFNDLQSKKKFSMMQVYGKSKLANILFTYELTRRIENSGVVVNCLHPGIVRTNIGREFPWFMRMGLKLVMAFAKSPEKGAETSIYLASSPEVANISGKYFINKKMRKSTPISYDVEIQKQLWKESETLIQAIIPEFSTSV